MFGAREAAWPLIRADLHLDYLGIGLLLSIPGIIGAIMQPAFGLLGDSGRRGVVVRAGGAAFLIGLVAVASSRSFAAILIASIVLFPASGAFVSLSQATLMDHATGRREHHMARWVLAGSIGVVVGPLLLAGSVTLGWGWRPVLFALGLAALPLVIMWRPHPATASRAAPSLADTFGRALASLRRRDVLRWLAILELTDLLGDVFLGYVAVYLVDASGAGVVKAGLGIAIWSGAGLAGDAALIAILRRTDALHYLRVTAGLALVAYPMFLVTHPLPVKLALLGALGLLHAGWYAIPKGRLFDLFPGASGTAIAIADVTGLAGRFLPLVVGAAAARFGIAIAMWPLVLAPLSLLVLVPRRRSTGA